MNVKTFLITILIFAAISCNTLTKGANLTCGDPNRDPNRTEDFITMMQYMKESERNEISHQIATLVKRGAILCQKQPDNVKQQIEKAIEPKLHELEASLERVEQELKLLHGLKEAHAQLAEKPQKNPASYSIPSTSHKNGAATNNNDEVETANMYKTDPRFVEDKERAIREVMEDERKEKETLRELQKNGKKPKEMQMK
ncbi:MAG: hypothetical protein E7028_01030 [Planctomycetaceae bacterium]|nr:hypothetical protein [Planctomycetaceae bacterium]